LLINVENQCGFPLEICVFFIFCPLSADDVDLKAWQSILATPNFIIMFQLKLLTGLRIRNDQLIEGGVVTREGKDVTILLGTEKPPINTPAQDTSAAGPPPLPPDPPPETEEEL
jgi:hypothetical protein